MKLLTISNLYPRPDQPQRGIFNAQLFEAMAEQIRIQNPVSSILNICLVPEWRVWKWPEIRKWDGQYSVNSEQSPEFRTKNPELNIRTIYLPVFYFPVFGRSLSWWTYFLGLKKFKELISKCDVIFSTWLYPDGAAATLMADSCGKPAWIMVQGSDTFHLENPSRRRVILEACSKAKGIVCVCKSLADRMISVGVDTRKVYVVPNGVNGELFKYREKGEVCNKLQTGIQHSAFSIQHSKIILFVGNLVPVKGPDIMLRTWEAFGIRSRKSEIKDQNLQLMIIGDGDLRKRLERQVIELGVSSSVVFLGNRPHEEIALWMNAADCLCLPSRGEGMPNVVIEALVSGLPVVATDVGGVRELLENEPAGRIVPLSESSIQNPVFSNKTLVSRMTEAVAEVLETNFDRKKIAERNRGRFSWKKQARTILGLINGVKVAEKTSE